MDLRPYQSEFISDIHKAALRYRSLCCVLPTGGGKTVVFSSIAQNIIQAGGSVHALAHREEIVEQISSKFSDFGIQHGRVQPNRNIFQQPVLVGMIQTYRNRMQQLPAPRMLIIDECHHTPASQYAEILSAMPASTTILGFTATPERLDGKGLDKFYQTMVLGPSTPDLISLGYLSQPVVFAPELIDTSNLRTKYGDFDKTQVTEICETDAVIGGIVEHYEKFSAGKKAIVFCAGVNHAEMVADSFTANGHKASSVDGGMNTFVRRRILANFRAGEITILTSSDLVSEGFDLPDIETAILCRPTKSLGMYLQQTGRVLRVFEGKERAIIIDHVGNTKRHGLPDIYRTWSLEGAKKRAGEDEIDVTVCRGCFRAYTGRTCPDCKVEELTGLWGYTQRKMIDHIDGELVEVKRLREYATKQERAELWQCDTLNQLRAYADKAGIEFEAAKKAFLREAKTLPELRRVGSVFGYASGWAEHRAGANQKDTPGQVRLSL